ncbi:MAG: UDP-N-acetylglucosamine 2-epimerase (non-hydrolyzing) [Bacteroidetes bacterium]|nr:UDP-N-acetylglucosamine 2-epimerase (non-hydrolyzing) [Bacteroidota bacterium]
MLKLLTIVGARPQFIKAAALSYCINNEFQHLITEKILHTGQHYDTNMSAVFFNELHIPLPYKNLHTGSASHGDQIARMISEIEKEILAERPDAIVIYGDTNSTLAAALAACKLHIPVAHIEAGMRSYNKHMPEELNRITADQAASFLFCTSQSAVNNLIRENFNFKKKENVSINNPLVMNTGDLMYDAFELFTSKLKYDSQTMKQLKLSDGHYFLASVHRDFNVDNANSLKNIVAALETIAKSENMPVVFPAHPRTRRSMIQHQIKFNARLLYMIEPVSYLEMIWLEKNAALIITDSGGVQRESFFCKKPCVVLRNETEWQELVKNGNSMLTKITATDIVNAVNKMKNKKRFTYPPIFGDGHAARLICNSLIKHLS